MSGICHTVAFVGGGGQHSGSPLGMTIGGHYQGATMSPCVAHAESRPLDSGIVELDGSVMMQVSHIKLVASHMDYAIGRAPTCVHRIDQQLWFQMSVW